MVLICRLQPIHHNKHHHPEFIHPLQHSHHLSLCRACEAERGENRVRGGKLNTLSEIKKCDREDERRNKRYWGKLENNSGTEEEEHYDGKRWKVWTGKFTHQFLHNRRTVWPLNKINTLFSDCFSVCRYKENEMCLKCHYYSSLNSQENTYIHTYISIAHKRIILGARELLYV